MADCSAVADGIYILTVETGQQVSSAKVIIRHSRRRTRSIFYRLLS